MNNKVIQEQLAQLLHNVLDGFYNKEKGTFISYSPFCNHYKRKLNIDLKTGKYHCWISNVGGYSIHSLFKKMKLDNGYFTRLEKIVPNEYKFKEDSKKRSTTLFLPNQFISLKHVTPSPQWKRAIYYLKSRNITIEDIITYNIGYAESGKFKNSIIIPSYDKNGRLNYYVSRLCFDSKEYAYSNSPNSKKDIIMFEVFINWHMPIILVEGSFDALTVKNNVIPLLGKNLNNVLFNKLIIHKPVVYICLDSDALEDSINIYEKLNDVGVDSYIVKLPKNSDPNSLGFKKIWNLIENSSQNKNEDMFSTKIKNLLND